jgi:hypothetical protein
MHYVARSMSVEQIADIDFTILVHIPVNQVLVGGA